MKSRLFQTPEHARRAGLEILHAAPSPLTVAKERGIEALRGAQGAALSAATTGGKGALTVSAVGVLVAVVTAGAFLLCAAALSVFTLWRLRK